MSAERTSNMELFQYPLSLNCQKVRIALEEKNLDYVLHEINPLKAKNLDPDFFRENSSGALPVLKNGNVVICESLPILQYINGINGPIGDDKVHHEKVDEWVKKVDEWDAKTFTLSHVSEGTIRFFSRFKRRVVIARMAKNPDLANKYHNKLNSMHAMEEKLKSSEALSLTEKQLIDLLDEAEDQLGTTEFMAGFEFSIADAAFVPVLARIQLLKLVPELLKPRPRLLDYFVRMKKRPSYKEVIQGYSSQLKQMRVLVPSMCNVAVRKLFSKY
jgi:glutathione S-transferase